MNTFKKVLQTLLGLVVLGGLIWMVYEIIILISKSLVTVNPNILIVIGGVLGSIITVFINRYFQSKRDKESVHRNKKIELYDSLLSKLFGLFANDPEKTKDDKDLVSFLRETQRKFILWSGPEVIKRYAEWNHELTSHTGNPRAKAMIGMIDLFLALRKDLGHSNSGIQHEHLVRFMLKNPELFMQMYKNNSEVTFKEISQKEQELIKMNP